MVAAGRLRRFLIANCSRARSLRGSGGCVVAGGRLWSPLVGCGAVFIVNCNRSRSVVWWKLRTGDFLVQLYYAEQSVELEAENWRLCSTTLVREVAGR